MRCRHRRALKGNLTVAIKARTNHSLGLETTWTHCRLKDAGRDALLEVASRCRDLDLGSRRRVIGTRLCWRNRSNGHRAVDLRRKRARIFGRITVLVPVAARYRDEYAFLYRVPQ